ncbi:hypothetical protein HOG17_04525 [Candidatus Peregrinibacteria bacterium]|nr:hypothetical protein [Candidatus Peregrinibacteria bacterium]MBT4147831.1 hypothetical protein [Candidatus Peregrinibacteria bacterium]MBT4366172.1 hypothetical protein [Candidatus Peregrinibacteria bacterium]MBT4455577.1 hypothetical protein [Candidatus Peregrinibacteria bacterium]
MTDKAEFNPSRERAKRLESILTNTLSGIEQQDGASEEVLQIVRGVRKLVDVEGMFPGLSREGIDMIAFVEGNQQAGALMLDHIEEQMEEGNAEENNTAYKAAKEALEGYLQDEDTGNMERAIQALEALGTDLFPQMPKAAIANQEFFESVMASMAEEPGLDAEKLKQIVQLLAVSEEEPEILIETLSFSSHDDVNFMIENVDMILDVGEEHKDTWVSMLRMSKVRHTNDVVVRILDKLVEVDEFDAKILWETFDVDDSSPGKLLTYCTNRDLRPEALAFMFGKAEKESDIKRFLEKLEERKAWRTIRNLRTEVSGSSKRHLAAEALDRNVDEIQVNVDNEATIEIGRKENSDQPSVFLTIGMIGRSKEARLRVIERMDELVEMEQTKKAAQILARIAGANPHGRRKGADDEYYDEEVIAAAKVKLADVVMKMSDDGEF